MKAKRFTSAALAAFITLGSVAPTAAVACEGSGEEKSGVVEFAPSSLDFGKVLLNKPETLPDKLVASSGEVAIKELRSTSTEFALLNNTCNGKTLKWAIPGPKECTFEVTFTPIFTGTRSGQVEAKESAGFAAALLQVEGIGKNEVKTEPKKLTWASGEKVSKKFKLETLTAIKVSKFELSDSTDFKVTQLAKCKEGESFATLCEVEIERTTSTIASATFKWKYEEGGKVFEAPSGELEAN
jgi:hypothetical protein